MVTGHTSNITGQARRVSGFFDRGAIIVGGAGRLPSFTLWSASLKKNVTSEIKKKMLSIIHILSAEIPEAARVFISSHF